MTTALTTTTALAPISAVQPKPTKTEIINAMVARAKIKHDAENAARKKRREVIEKKLESLAIKAVKARGFDGKAYVTPRIYRDPASCFVEVEFRVNTPEAQELMQQVSDNSSLYWDEKQTREDIRNALSGRTESRLLDSPEAVAAIDAMLEKWGI